MTPPHYPCRPRELVTCRDGPQWMDSKDAVAQDTGHWYRPHCHREDNDNDHNKNQIDNTGNVCVWDAEKPLTWALNEELQEQLVLRKTRKSTVPTDPDKHQTREFLPLLSPSQTPEPDATTTTPMVLGTVLKLGAGMAGLAALSLGPYAHRIVLRDGHLYCVQSNRVSMHLIRAWQALVVMYDTLELVCAELIMTCLDDPFLLCKEIYSLLEEEMAEAMRCTSGNV